MFPIGRKIVRNFGKSHICIEILPIETSPYTVDEKEILIYDILNFLGERTEKLVGKAMDPRYGSDMNSCMPGNHPYAWITEDEHEKNEGRWDIRSHTLFKEE